jgi:hypothetical protein
MTKIVAHPTEIARFSAAAETATAGFRFKRLCFPMHYLAIALKKDLLHIGGGAIGALSWDDGAHWYSTVSENGNKYDKINAQRASQASAQRPEKSRKNRKSKPLALLRGAHDGLDR